MSKEANSTERALKLALEALENSVDLVREDAYQAEKLYGNYPTRQGKVAGLKVLADDHEKAISALREALEQPAQKCSYPYCGCNSKAWCKVERNEALDKKAENARELGLDYEPMRQEPVAHAVIAGALFDFMGWLTSRKERLVLSSADNASPAVEAITEFAKMRGLSLNDAKVQDWNTSPPAQRTWVGLTNNELQPIADEYRILFGSWVEDFARAIEAKLKEKNNG